MSTPPPKVWLELAEQTAAITHRGSPLLILAGAGSGKTTVMARRMAHLICEQGWEPEQILGLTFSNKAASNLRARAINELGPGSNVSVQTYHGFGASIVNANYARLGFSRPPRLIDRAEAWQLLYGALDTVAINHRKTGRLGSLINEALALASSCADHLVAIETVSANCHELLGPAGPRLADNAKRALQYRLDLCGLATAYAQAKKSYDCIDFSDQLALAAHAVGSFSAVAADLRNRHPVVLLDEYQDTNFAQRKLLELLYITPSAESGESLAANVTAVGDDMQSIYGFRGAHLSNITNFEQHIPGAVERRLETNHRSGALVVDIANYVQAQVPSARPKTLRVRDDAPAATLTSFIGADDSSEAAEIAKRCLDIGAPWAEIAVLCRKRKVIPAIVSALKAAGVPVEVMGMGGLLARPEVVDLMAWLEIICAPTDMFAIDSPEQSIFPEVADQSWLGPDPSIALLRILQGPRFRVGMRDLGALGRSARRLAKARQGDGRRVDLMAALVQTDSISELSAEAYGRCKQFVHLRSTLRALLNRSASERSIADVIDAIVQEVGLYCDVDGIGYENLLRFIDVAARFSPLSDRAPRSETALSSEVPDIDALGRDIEIGIDIDTDALGRDIDTDGSGRDIEIGIEIGIDIDTDGSGRGIEIGVASYVGFGIDTGRGVSHGTNGGTARGRDPLYREPPTVRTAMLSFLEYLQLVAESEDDPAEATQTGADAVQIMSIHQAKGLEFDTVFLAGIAGTKKSSSIFPDERLPANGVTQAAVLPPWLQADGDPTVPPISHYKEVKVLSDAARQRANEEELRLLYVAVTRARKNLICSTGHWYPGPATAHGPSAFFDLLQASGLVRLAKSEPAATEDPAASLRKRRLHDLSEKLDLRNRAKSSNIEYAASRGVATGLFGEPLPASAGRNKGARSRRLKPLPPPLRSPQADVVLASVQGLAITSLPVSALGVVGVCPRKYHWTYVLPLPRRRSPAAEFGTAAHAWIESINDGSSTPFRAPDPFSSLLDPMDHATSTFSHEAGSTQLIDPANSSENLFTGETLADRVQRNYLASWYSTCKPALHESAFSYTPKVSPQRVVLTGRMDAVYKHNDGTVELVDFKTSRAPGRSNVLDTGEPSESLLADLVDRSNAGSVDLVDLVDVVDLLEPVEPVKSGVQLSFSLPVETAVQMAAYGLVALDAWGVAGSQLRTTVCYLGGDELVLHTTLWDEQTATQQRNLVSTHVAKALSGSTGVIPSSACSHCDFNAFCEGVTQISKRGY